MDRGVDAPDQTSLLQEAVLIRHVPRIIRLSAGPDLSRFAEASPGADPKTDQPIAQAGASEGGLAMASPRWKAARLTTARPRVAHLRRATPTSGPW